VPPTAAHAGAHAAAGSSRCSAPRQRSAARASALPRNPAARWAATGMAAFVMSGSRHASSAGSQASPDRAAPCGARRRQAPGARVRWRWCLPVQQGAYGLASSGLARALTPHPRPSPRPHHRLARQRVQLLHPDQHLLQRRRRERAAGGVGALAPRDAGCEEAEERGAAKRAQHGGVRLDRAVAAAAAAAFAGRAVRERRGRALFVRERLCQLGGA
jgi:hypothetical protein